MAPVAFGNLATLLGLLRLRLEMTKRLPLPFYTEYIIRLIREFCQIVLQEINRMAFFPGEDANRLSILSCPSEYATQSALPRDQERLLNLPLRILPSFFHRFRTETAVTIPDENR